MPPSFFSSVAQVGERLAATGYIATPAIATTVFLADRLDRPILLEGPAGVGKTELARAIAATASAELVRLQCYEGLDESKALYEWEYPKQLLYAQLVRDAVSQQLREAASLGAAVDAIAAQDDAFFSERFLLARPLLRAIRSPQRVVLLIDEVDRADVEFEAFLLEVLADFAVSVPEIGTLTAIERPLCVLTSNNVRELSDALRRRCLHLHLDYPDAARELQIVKSRLPDVDTQLATRVVATVQRLRERDLKKKPSIAETLDWLRALAALGARVDDPSFSALLEATLGAIVKFEGDAEEARRAIAEGLRAT